MGREAGYSLIELLVAAGLVAAAVSIAFGITSPSEGAFSGRLEAADVQQRMRVATELLSTDLTMAGAGSYAGAQGGPLNYYVAPLLPYRFGTADADPAGAFRSDTVTLLYIPQTEAQTTIAAQIDSSDFVINLDPGCPIVQPACGFKVHDTVLVYDASGHFDTFAVTGTTVNSLGLAHNGPGTAASTIFGPGAKIVSAVERTYSLKSDEANHQYRLVSYDPTSNTEVPVVDHLVALRFDYYGDPRPPSLTTATCDPNPRLPCTTYGPQPPPLGVQTTGYPPGENCAFIVDPADGGQAPRLEMLGGDPSLTALVPLTSSQLTDGPWCPDSVSANRFDADLLRIRKVVVTLRVEAASGAARGSGPLFVHAGTNHDVRGLVPDQEIRFQVSLRNSNLNR